MTDYTQLLLLILLAAVGFLIYKVVRLERMIQDDPRIRRRIGRTQGEGKVVPILKEHIEPGPFRKKPDRNEE